MRPTTHGAYVPRQGYGLARHEAEAGFLCSDDVMNLPNCLQEEASHSSQPLLEHILKVLLITSSVAIMATLVIRVMF